MTIIVFFIGILYSTIYINTMYRGILPKMRKKNKADKSLNVYLSYNRNVVLNYTFNNRYKRKKVLKCLTYFQIHWHFIF